ncbi:MAG: hypothetical protein J7L44_00540 [Candidatus Diapherotrites archaeon]|nr:hypothetical protein [Candidatus Diapherotrites archaeon]
MNKQPFIYLALILLAFNAYGFTITTELIPTTLPDGSTGYALEPSNRPSGRALVREKSITVDITSATESNLALLFDNMHVPYTFTLRAILPTVYRKDGSCIYRCPTDTGPKANIVLEYEYRGRRRTVNEGRYKAVIDKVFYDYVVADNIRYEIKRIDAPSFYETTYEVAKGPPQTWYVASNTDGTVSVDFCIRFRYRDPVTGYVKPLTDSICVESYEEFYQQIIVANAEAFTEAAEDIVQVAGTAIAQQACDADWAQPTEWLEVRARPKQSAVEANIRGRRFNMFAIGEIDETKEDGFIIDLSNFQAEDTGRKLFHSYKVELVSFSPKILTPDGKVVQRAATPAATIKFTDLEDGSNRYQRMEYHESSSALERKYNISGWDDLFVVRLYQNPEDIEMPYFVDNANNQCRSNCDFVPGRHCYDAYLKFAVKVRKTEKGPIKYTWYMRKKYELERLNMGPNLTVEVIDSETGRPLGAEENARATITFNDPVTEELYIDQKQVVDGIAKFNAPLHVPIHLSVDADEYVTWEQDLEITTIDDYAVSVSMVVSRKPFLLVVFSGPAFKTLVERYMPYYKGRDFPEVFGNDLSAYPLREYKNVYKALIEDRIFKLVDPQGNEKPFTIEEGFTGTITHEGYIIPLHTILKFDNMGYGVEYKALFYTPDPQVLQPYQRPANASQIKVIEIPWTFDPERGLIEGEGTIRDAQPGEWP